ncbi:hypothetical protein ElyMa_006179500 [Elysia marginata]|uniref:Uncharacterized protein n=1 Tax=Elysia marginata TaxID=1093978 RepID=A0AAV4H223_9GAST|nr:hypothetical protein ElyMa_006179500 [Elysia marginata]
MELWYFTNAACASLRSHSLKQYYRPILDRSSPLFPLACFKHFFQTWLGQTGFLYDEMFSKENVWATTKPGDVTNPAALIKACDVLLNRMPSNLPNYVTETLIKLCLVLPNFLERSLYSMRVYLSQGYPLMLGDGKEFMHDLFARKIPEWFEPGYSLEFFFSQTRVGPPFVKFVNSGPFKVIMVLFSPEACIVWVGNVDFFPKCEQISTCALKTIDAETSLEALKTEMGDVARAFDDVFSAQSRDKSMFLGRLFPGLLIMVHDRDRTQVFKLLDKHIDLLALKIDSLISSIALDSSLGSLNSSIPPELQNVLRTFRVSVQYRHPDSYTCHTTMRSQSLLLQHPTSSCDTHIRLVDAIQSSLHEEFDKEAAYFTQNGDTHKLTLSGWSISSWPFHLIVKGLAMVDNALKTCEKLSQ